MRLLRSHCSGKFDIDIDIDIATTTAHATLYMPPNVQRQLYENLTEIRPHGQTRELPVLPRSDSTSEFMPLEEKEVEYFFASDASAVIEHTNRVIYLEVIPCKYNQLVFK